MADAPASKTRLRQRLSLAIYVALVAAAVFLAYQVRVFWLQRQMTSIVQSGKAGTLDLSRVPSSQPWPLEKPANMPGAPLDESGLETLQGDPAQLPPPPGARREAGFVHNSAGMIYQQRSYLVEGEVSDVAEHYKNVFDQNGYQLIQNEIDGQDASMTFVSDAIQANVALRKLPAKDKIVRVVLIVASPAPA